MGLTWVIVYPLHAKFPFSSWVEALNFYKLACIYFPDEIDIDIPF